MCYTTRMLLYFVFFRAYATLFIFIFCMYLLPHVYVTYYSLNYGRVAARTMDAVRTGRPVRGSCCGRHDSAREYTPSLAFTLTRQHVAPTYGALGRFLNVFYVCLSGKHEEYFGGDSTVTLAAEDEDQGDQGVYYFVFVFILAHIVFVSVFIFPFFFVNG